MPVFDLKIENVSLIDFLLRNPTHSASSHKKIFVTVQKASLTLIFLLLLFDISIPSFSMWLTSLSVPTKLKTKVFETGFVFCFNFAFAFSSLIKVPEACGDIGGEVAFGGIFKGTSLSSTGTEIKEVSLYETVSLCIIKRTDTRRNLPWWGKWR